MSGLDQVGEYVEDFDGRVYLDAPHPIYFTTRKVHPHTDSPRIYLGAAICRKLNLDRGGEYVLEPHKRGILITSEYSRNDTKSAPGGNDGDV